MDITDARASANRRGGDDRRGETDAERSDRNFEELLQELRVAQTGVQILFAFLLTVAFAPGFERLGEDQRRWYGVTVAIAAAAMAFLVGPVACHRLSFRRRRKELILAISHGMAIVGLALLGLAVTGCVYLACWAALGSDGARLLGAVTAAVLLANWVFLPLVIRQYTPRQDKDD